MSLPVVLSCGEPAGVGPELTLKAYAHLREQTPFFVIADPAHLAPFSTNCAPLIEISEPSQAADAFARGLPVLPHVFSAPNSPGHLEPRNAEDVINVIKRAVAIVTDGQASALCTNPIHKQGLAGGAGFAFPGHTEFLAHLTGQARPVMMLAAPELRVVPVTIHIAISAVPTALTAKLLHQTITVTHAALIQDFAVASPRIAVAGLNPHAGEGGVMGREEIDIITPVLDELRATGMDISGPMSADTMFHAPSRARFDVAICMYHDQALIPLKALNFKGGTNITLGLPIVRTSPDHGTALDIAGKGIANPESLIAAIRQAHLIAANRVRGL